MKYFRGLLYLWFALSVGTAQAQGVLQGSHSLSAAEVNLTAEGTADWTHWGASIDEVVSLDCKATGKGQISNYVTLGKFQARPRHDYATGFSWIDGTPGFHTHTTDGILTGNYAVGAGFVFTAPADTRFRTLKVYVGVDHAVGKFTAHLSDGSAPDYVHIEMPPAKDAKRCLTYTLIYRARNAEQTLRISWVNERTLGDFSSVFLQSATLAEGRPQDRFLPPAFDGAFVTSLAQGRDGAVWVGTEGMGLWRYQPGKVGADAWRQFTAKDGLGDDTIYAVACDKQSRVWVGHLNHGVSVWNGRQWKNYDRLTGPLGERVFRIAVCPTDGDVWIASSLGLSRYSEKDKCWSYFTRAEGLPSDQISAIAFDRSGNIYLGTQCDGLVRAFAAEKYLNWSHTPGPEHLPTTASGTGLPSGLINDLLMTRKGVLYAATSAGLAVSPDSGAHWTFRRGEDWIPKAERLFRRPAKIPAASAPGLLAEDYVTCLAEDDAGRMWLGYRRNGYEILLPADKTRPQRVQPERGNLGDWVTALLPLHNAPLWAGRYEPTGLTALPLPKQSADAAAEDAPLPLPAAPPSAASLAAALEKLKTPAEPMPPGTGMFLGEDWTTQGDWVGRYGRCDGILAAMKSPINDYFGNRPGYDIQEQIGPHHREGDSIRYWVHWMKSDNPSVLYNPVLGYRRQADWDDHGEDYFMLDEGPNIWLAVTVPEGTHRISLYIFNRSGHGDWFNLDRFRDYVVELRTFRPSLEEAETLPALARTRVQNAWGGVYKQFVVQGAGKFYIKICRNYSVNAICSGIFIDKSPADIAPDDVLAWMGQIPYNPPTPMLSQAGSIPPANTPQPPLIPAQQFWSVLDTESSKEQAGLLFAYRVMTYRALVLAKISEDWLTNYRWQIGLWTPDDRKQFESAMARSWQALTLRNPELKAAALQGLP